MAAIQYKSIAVVRNPIDRQKSFYYFYKRWKNQDRTPSIEEYNSWTRKGAFLGEPNSGILQSDILKWNGETQGEYWLYENINNDLNQLMRELNLEVTHVLPKHKNDFRKNRNNEIEFDELAMNNLSKYFGPDIDLYNELAEETYV
jgi:hypothetical protein